MMITDQLVHREAISKCRVKQSIINLQLKVNEFSNLMSKLKKTKANTLKYEIFKRALCTQSK